MEEFREPRFLEILFTLVMTGVFSRFYRDYAGSLGLRGDERVLEFGSGSGVLARYLGRALADGGGTLTCIDASNVWIRLAARRLARLPNVRCMQGDVAALTRDEAGAYDAVVIHFVLHDLPRRQRPEKLAALARALRPGGRIYVREPFRETHGIFPEEVDGLMAECGMEAESRRITGQGLPGPLFTGVYRKPGEERDHGR